MYTIAKKRKPSCINRQHGRPLFWTAQIMTDDTWNDDAYKRIRQKPRLTSSSR